MNKYIGGFFDHFEYEALTFGDVSIRPIPSEVEPRLVNLETKLGPHVALKVPFMSANMDSVTESEMAIAMAKQGGIGFLWKHDDIEKQLQWVKTVKYHINGRNDSPITIRENATMKEREQLLSRFQNDFSTLVVVDSENRVVGSIGKRQTQFSSNEKDLVSSFMKTDIEILEKDFESVEDAYKHMKQKGRTKVFIVDGDKRLKSLYSYTDVSAIMEGKIPMYNVDSNNHLVVGADVGIGRDFMERTETLLENGCDSIMIATSKGDTPVVINAIDQIHKTFRNKYSFDLIGGNVASEEGAKLLYEAGADTVKVGIGGGSICTTRIVTGAGTPQLTAVYRASLAKNGRPDRYLIADGGIQYSGDVTKALAIGADSVMMGGVFASAYEAPGEEITFQGKTYKAYRGMGSEGAMNRSKGSAQRYNQEQNSKLVAEGVEAMVELRGTVEDVIFQFAGGLRSGMGHVGAENILELQNRAQLDKMTAAGSKESHVHDVTITHEPKNYSR